MDYLIQSCGIIRVDKIINVAIKERAGINIDIIKIIKAKFNLI